MCYSKKTTKKQQQQQKTHKKTTTKKQQQQHNNNNNKLNVPVREKTLILQWPLKILKMQRALATSREYFRNTNITTYVRRSARAIEI